MSQIDEKQGAMPFEMLPKGIDSDARFESLLQPGDPTSGRAVHFIDMGHGVHSPGIGWRDLDRNSAYPFGVAVLPVLTQGEGMASQHVAEARNFRRSAADHGGRRSQQASEIASLEPNRVHQLDRHEIPRNVSEHGIKRPQRSVDIAPSQRRQGRRRSCARDPSHGDAPQRPRPLAATRRIVRRATVEPSGTRRSRPTRARLPDRDRA